MKKIHLLIIDPQNDFCDMPMASLPVTGACQDMIRIASIIDRVGYKLSEIHVTLDSHRIIDIAHPAFWVNLNNKQPPPYTIISHNDIKNGMWTPCNPEFLNHSLNYTKQLESTGKYQLCVWPPHCLIGTWGHNVHFTLNAALQNWSNNYFTMVDYIMKGTNPFTEHYGALQAEVPVPYDSSTYLNDSLIYSLSSADTVGIVGEASSHCVKETVLQIVKYIGPDPKFHIITDCMSSVVAIPNGPDFPAITKIWLKDMEKLGLTLTDSGSFLK
jgi:nicotinamidase-related amidase